MLLANYLATERQRIVTVIDMDYQQSVTQQFERVKNADVPPPYEVIPANIEQYQKIKPLLSENMNQFILIDLPGKLDDDGLIEVFRTADLVLCPFCYDQLSFDSTVLFSFVLRQLNPEVPIAYIPNRVKANVKYTLKAQITDRLSKFGAMQPELPDRVDFQRTNTRYTPIAIQAVVKPSMDSIYDNYLAFLDYRKSL